MLGIAECFSGGEESGGRGVMMKITGVGEVES